METAARIQAIQRLTGSRSYLEIGVSKGATFNSLKFDQKVAVDPVFRFDTNLFSNPETLFFQETSNDFFLNHAEKRVFDLFFIDGLHTYDQTYTDFLNCLLHSHDESVFVIDDTFPIDFASTMRDPQFTHHLRKQQLANKCDEASTAWNGDTFKILFLIKMYNTLFDYSTIVNCGNPQTIIWKKRLNSLAQSSTPAELEKPFKEFRDQRYLRGICESLDKADYVWTFNNCPDIFQSSSESELLAYLDSLYSVKIDT